MSFVQRIHFQGLAVTSVTSGSLTTTANNCGIFSASVWVNGTNNQPTASDSKGNSWAVDVSVVDGGNAKGRVSIGHGQLASGGSGHTFTLNQGSSAYIEGDFSEFSQVVTSSALDKTATNQVASGTTSTSTTATLAQADELIIAAIVVNVSSSNVHLTDPPSGYTSIGVNQDPNTSIGYEAAYKIVSATTAVSATWTFDSAAAASAIATYKTTGGGGGGLIVNPLTGRGGAAAQPLAA